MQSYRDLVAWQQAIDLVDESYELCKLLPADERFGLVSQIQRAAVSVPANIAEGSMRDSTKDYLRFLAIARGSLAEVSTFLVILRRRNYVTSLDIDKVEARAERVGRLLSSLRSSLRAKLANHTH